MPFPWNYLGEIRLAEEKTQTSFTTPWALTAMSSCHLVSRMQELLIKEK